ncbi:unnamed protein product, partial [Mesorhabditis belari]|uniref:Protein kinase domain-containing protein n=1 Tax=Mesorhabditis belari TaxID=2138241 RepID=A0AAF3J9L9_9BILA
MNITDKLFQFKWDFTADDRLNYFGQSAFSIRVPAWMNDQEAGSCVTGEQRFVTPEFQSPVALSANRSMQRTYECENATAFTFEMLEYLGGQFTMVLFNGNQSLYNETINSAAAFHNKTFDETDQVIISALYLDQEHTVAIKMAHLKANEKDKADLLQEIEFMKTLEDKLTDDDLVPLAWQISDALSYLSSRKMIHRDVAARNVLLAGTKMAKLSDFGLCRLSDEMFYTTKGGKLPIKWMAPESLEFGVFTEKTDVWSFGVFLYELFTYGAVPYIGVDPELMLSHLKDQKTMHLPDAAPEIM